jgi:hypothetical protein
MEALFLWNNLKLLKIILPNNNNNNNKKGKTYDR